MELKHIAIEHLSVSRANMRGGRKRADIAGILPSVGARGVGARVTRSFDDRLSTLRYLTIAKAHFAYIKLPFSRPVHDRDRPIDI